MDVPDLFITWSHTYTSDDIVAVPGFTVSLPSFLSAGVNVQVTLTSNGDKLRLTVGWYFVWNSWCVTTINTIQLMLLQAIWGEPTTKPRSQGFSSFRQTLAVNEVESQPSFDISSLARIASFATFQSYDARRKFGKHERSVRFAQSASERQSIQLKAWINCLITPAVRMRKVLARPWVGVRVCHLFFIVILAERLWRQATSKQPSPLPPP